VFFTFGIALLVVLSGGGLLYFGFGVQKTSTLSPVQVAAATATAVAQTYATGTTKQGIMLGFDAAHTNHNPYEQTLGPGNVSRLTPLWSFTTEGAIISSPAVAGGMVYVSSYDGKLYAFDATCRQKCQPLWSFTTGNGIYSSPAVADGVVYVGSDDHKLYAFGLAS
jgi:outer membrane protein assembly factor BamB